MVSSKSISRSLSLSTQKILRSDSRFCDNVERSTLLILFSFENDLSPEQFVTTKHRNNLTIVSPSEKQPGFFSCLIIWYNANSGVRRKFPREGPSFVTIVWRHKSTLGEVPKHDHSRDVRGNAPGKILQITPKNTHFRAFWKQVLA